MHRLICIFVVRIWHKQVFSWESQIPVVSRKPDVYWLLAHNVMMHSVMFSIEIMSTFKAIKPHLKYDKQNLTLVVISYEIYETRQRLVSQISYEMTTCKILYIFSQPNPCAKNVYGPRHRKTNKMSVCLAKIQISLGIRPVWSESSLRTQADLSLCWAHSHFVGFVMSRLVC